MYGYTLSEEKTQCLEIIKNCEVYNNDFSECEKCKNNSYFLGSDRTNCTSDININNFFSEDGESYYLCKDYIEYCKECINKNICTKCESKYFLLNNNKSICHNINEIDITKYYTEDNITYSLCSDILYNCEECDNKNNCSKCQNNYSLVIDRTKNCHKEEDIDKKKYFSEDGGETYISCNSSISNFI